MINKLGKIYIAGHRGVVGSACWRALEARGYTNHARKTSKERDIRNQKAVEEFLRTEKPIAIIDAAAKVRGILANDRAYDPVAMEGAKHDLGENINYRESDMDAVLDADALALMTEWIESSAYPSRRKWVLP